jgi:hypothetical protein
MGYAIILGFRHAQQHIALDTAPAQPDQGSSDATAQGTSPVF